MSDDTGRHRWKQLTPAPEDTRPVTYRLNTHPNGRWQLMRYRVVSGPGGVEHEVRENLAGVGKFFDTEEEAKAYADVEAGRHVEWVPDAPR